MTVDEEVGTADTRTGDDAVARTGSGMTGGVGGLTSDGFAWYWTPPARPSDWISLSIRSIRLGKSASGNENVNKMLSVGGVTLSMGSS